jgi:hypothetical protein
MSKRTVVIVLKGKVNGYHYKGRYFYFSFFIPPLFLRNFTVADFCDCVTYGVVCSLAAHDVYVQAVYEHCLQCDDSQIIRNSVLKVRSISVILQI